MKFGESFLKSQTSEWSSQYVFYDDLKRILYDLMNKNKSKPPGPSIPSDCQVFFQCCEKEQAKVTTFFAEKLAEAILKCDLLKNELEFAENKREIRRPFTFTNRLYQRKSSDNEKTLNNNENRHSALKRQQFKNLDDLKFVFTEFYLNLILLKNYQTSNYMAFYNILKKYDKSFETTTGFQWRKEHIDESILHRCDRVDKMIDEIERIYTNSFEFGDRKRAMMKLRVPPLEEKQPKIVTFRFGIFIGMICILIPLLIIAGTSFFSCKSCKTINWRAGLHLYRWSLFLIIHLILFGINVYGWSKSGINHILIFEIDPRNHLTYQHLLEIGTFLMACWLLSFNGFLISFYFGVYPFLQPFLFVLFLIIFIVNPIGIFYKQSRYWFIKRLFRVFLSPFYHVDFIDFWLGDQLCSLELVFFDLEFFICFYLNQSNWGSSDSSHSSFCNGWFQMIFQTILLILPSWLRFLQCLRRYRDTKEKFPHLVNAGKYASGFFVSITNGLRRMKSFDYHHDKYENPFVYLWILTSLISSTYKVIWDIKMDWGLFEKSSEENKYLREQIVYSKKNYYYVSIVLNIILRYIWMINIFIHFKTLSAEYSDIIGLTFGLVEIFRRFIWNYFRLENEHINNCGQFRAVRDISICVKSIPKNNFELEPIIGEQSNQVENEHISAINPRFVSFTSNETFQRKKTDADLFIDEINQIFSN